MSAQSAYFARKLASMRGGPGRTAVASPELRENNYRDGDGHYVLVGGLKPWHTRIVDFMLLNPAATVKSTANAFGVTPVWLGQLMKSDGFKEYYASRMSEHQRLVHQMAITKMQGIQEQTLTKISEKVREKDLSVGQLVEVFESVSDRLGYGQKAGPSVVVNSSTTINEDKRVINMEVQQSAVERARLKLAQVRAQNTASEEVSQESDYAHITAGVTIPDLSEE